jgi:predicted nucleotidyltransferase
MSHGDIKSAIKDLATRTNQRVGEASWYLFGSSRQGFANASDIDLVVVCKTNSIADAIRRTVDVDQLTRPIHLTILTESEEAEMNFVEKRGCIPII